MRGRSSTWTRIRLNLRHVPEAERPAQEELDVDYDPWARGGGRPVDNARAETHVRLLAEDQLRRALTSPRYRWLDEDFQAGGQPPVEVGLHAVSAVLGAFGQVGVLSRATAARLGAEFADALAVRGLHDPRGLASPDPPMLAQAGPGGPARTGAPATGSAAQGARGATGGRYLAVPVGAVIPAEWDGHQGEVHVLALVLAPDRAAITTSFVSSWREAAATPGVPALHSPVSRRLAAPGSPTTRAAATGSPWRSRGAAGTRRAYSPCPRCRRREPGGWRCWSARPAVSAST